MDICIGARVNFMDDSNRHIKGIIYAVEPHSDHILLSIDLDEGERYRAILIRRETEADRVKRKGLRLTLSDIEMLDSTFDNYQNQRIEPERIVAAAIKKARG